ncbi:Mis12 protein-domain-containing protein [Elsinoe ampelina]|uniref:Mis12 protein-domain-containing protein n=1 Tax=Elsinoe ampelina TaxID=302913 RepID=A0A6A6GA11_9PEZI|nr:Mis12 protein-domain-containing protein [Elsinoe ampelina]
MPSPDQIKTALLTEHFRYTPLTLLDDIINSVNQLVFEAVNQIEESLLNADTETLGFTKQEGISDEDFDAIARTEVEAGIVQLESLLNSVIDKNFDKLEIYTLRNLLTVSNVKEEEGLENWIVLDHYRDLKEPSDAAMGDATMESFETLRKQVQETDKLHRALKAEVARNEALLAKLRPLGLDGQGSRQSIGGIDQSLNSVTSNGIPEASSFSFLSSVPAASELEIITKRESRPLTQNTKFTLAQLPALKKLLEDLRPHLASVPRPGPGSEAQRTRDAYIESQSRKAMARNGVEPGQSGDAVPGRPVTAEEVKALETIADALGGASNTRMEE